MSKADPYRDKTTIGALLGKIAERRKSLPSSCRIMEVCGTHTMTLHRFGLKRMLADAGVEMIAGPGCPVCITPDAIHDAALRLVAQRENTILAAFGDMTRVPTARGSLQTTPPAPGSQVRIVYSPADSLDLARRHPDKDVVFFGAGFETTIPSIAYTAAAAVAGGVKNYSVLPALWLIPPPVRAILETGQNRIAGFLYPGHVTAVIGPRAFDFVAEEFKRPGAVAGFEPADILLGVLSVLEQIAAGRPRVANEYARVVGPEGNPAARAIMDRVLEPADAVWRGLGLIPRSGLTLRPDYAAVDAIVKHDLVLNTNAGDRPGCRCGDVLKGLIEPTECGLFGTRCRPDLPFGPCMVSAEGACLSAHTYGGDRPKRKGRHER